MSEPLPLTIKQISDTDGQCNVTVAMSWELARQLVQMAAPFMEDLTKQVEAQGKQQRYLVRQLQAVRDTGRYTALIALKALRTARKEDMPLEAIANRLGMEYNLAAHSITNYAHMLQKTRTQRLYRFRDRLIARRYAEGHKKLAIARATGTTVYIVNQVIANSSIKRIEQQSC